MSETDNRSNDSEIRYPTKAAMVLRRHHQPDGVSGGGGGTDGQPIGLLLALTKAS